MLRFRTGLSPRLLMVFLRSDADDQRALELPARKLSTLSLTRSAIVSDTESAWTIRLHPNDVCSKPNPSSRSEI